MQYSRLFNPAIPALIRTLAGCLGDEGEPVLAGDSGNNTSARNSAPKISGSPPSAVKVGEEYAFTPNASDADGDTLTFSIENRPNWLDFSSSNGRISGTPTLGNIETFPNIRLSVPDGKTTTSLSSFSIDITRVATASTTLQWSAPTQNEDGT